MARRLALNPDAIAAVMALESGVNAQAFNPDGGATGLIQFMPATAKRLGTTTEALRAMNATAQLKYVELFFRGAPGLRSGSRSGDYYIATFMPAFLGMPDGTPMAFRGTPNYDSNKGLDTSKDGVITVGEVRARLENELARASTVAPIVVDETAPSDASGAATTDGDGGLVVLVGLAGIGYYLWSRERKRRGRQQ